MSDTHVVARLRTEVATALAQPSVRQWFEGQDADIVASSPDEFAGVIRDELRRWADVIKVGGIKVQ